MMTLRSLSYTLPFINTNFYRLIDIDCCVIEKYSAFFMGFFQDRILILNAPSNEHFLFLT